MGNLAVGNTSKYDPPAAPPPDSQLVGLWNGFDADESIEYRIRITAEGHVAIKKTAGDQEETVRVKVVQWEPQPETQNWRVHGLVARRFFKAEPYSFTLARPSAQGDAVYSQYNDTVLLTKMVEVALRRPAQSISEVLQRAVTSDCDASCRRDVRR